MLAGVFEWTNTSNGEDNKNKKFYILLCMLYILVFMYALKCKTLFYTVE